VTPELLASVRLPGFLKGTVVPNSPVLFDGPAHVARGRIEITSFRKAADTQGLNGSAFSLVLIRISSLASAERIPRNSTKNLKANRPGVQLDPVLSG
jgi:hypothetical protein